MASFAAGLGLADLASTQSIGESSFLILDEPFSQLDARNSEAIVSYLTGDLSKERSTILLVSNDDTLMSLVPNRVHVVKEKGVSKIS
jgi:ABC-type dipeptide/oligopeptide/nickel transport system ATPase subunit